MTEEASAAEREARRREREARRANSGQAPKPAEKAPKAPKATKASTHSRRRRLGIALGLGVVLLGIAAIAALAYRHFHRSTPPPVVVKTITLTIPEGYTRSQTAEIAKQEGLRGSYENASVKSKYLDPAKYGGKGAKSLEGFLFPDTFELEKHAGIASLVQLQLEDFKRRIKGVEMSYARSKNLTTFDVITIASMIEREAGLESQRKLVAAVIYNRLHEGMPLGIDATTRFATGNYTEPLTESELAVDSPYNTRTHTGLPPGPINSPGLASIEAAAHPAKVGYLFYVVEPGACNKLAFSTTEAEFNADVERYNSAREAAGGNSPDSCGE
jgi:cell division protein YceG involved in septum cleavage